MKENRNEAETLITWIPYGIIGVSYTRGYCLGVPVTRTMDYDFLNLFMGGGSTQSVAWKASRYWSPSHYGAST